MTPLTAVRIAAPAWAKAPDAVLNSVRLSEYRAVQEHRAALLRAVHDEVQRYFDDTDLVFESESFPSRGRLTGEYYLGEESYEMHVGPVWIQIGVACHCLERANGSGRPEQDYLGLNVWVRCDPQAWSFEVFRNTDSSSI